MWPWEELGPEARGWGVSRPGLGSWGRTPWATCSPGPWESEGRRARLQPLPQSLRGRGGGGCARGRAG